MIHFDFIFSHLYFFLFILLFLYCLLYPPHPNPYLHRMHASMLLLEALSSVLLGSWLPPCRPRPWRWLHRMATERPGSAHLAGPAPGGHAWPITQLCLAGTDPNAGAFLGGGSWSGAPSVALLHKKLLGGIWLGPPRWLGRLPAPVIHGKAAGSATVLTKTGNVTGPPRLMSNNHGS